MDVILDREELYRDVWSKGAAMVARKYDLTEGDIRKACFALDVPRPARGYWSKLKAGDASPTPPLPPSGASTYVCTTVKRKPTRPVNESSPKKPAKEKESLVEWVLKNRAEMQTQKSSVQARQQPYGSMHLLPEDMIGLPRYIPLTFWIVLLLGEHAPHKNTVLRWVHEGRIYPQPIKVGKQWNVRKDAAYVPD